MQELEPDRTLIVLIASLRPDSAELKEFLDKAIQGSPGSNGVPGIVWMYSSPSARNQRGSWMGNPACSCVTQIGRCPHARARESGACAKLRVCPPNRSTRSNVCSVYVQVRRQHHGGGTGLPTSQRRQASQPHHQLDRRWRCCAIRCGATHHLWHHLCRWSVQRPVKRQEARCESCPCGPGMLLPAARPTSSSVPAACRHA